jgi:hypothetical protein
MSDITTKFDDFKNKKVKKFDKDQEFQPLSDDILAISKLDNGDYEKVTGPVKIVQITGVITDQDEIKKLDEIAGGPVINTDLGLKQVKRGMEIWITCLLQKPSNSAVYNSQSMGCLRVRIIDIYYGLSKLSTLK